MKSKTRMLCALLAALLLFACLPWTAFAAEADERKTVLTANIAAKPTVTVTANNASKYVGERDPKLTYTVKGLPQGGKALTGIVIEREAGETKGTYVITVSQTEGANADYNMEFVSGVFTIEEKPQSGRNPWHWLNPLNWFKPKPIVNPKPVFKPLNLFKPQIWFKPINWFKPLNWFGSWSLFRR